MSNLEQNSPDLKIENVRDIIKSLFPTAKLLNYIIVKESHQRGESHFHVFIKDDKGISKNTYREQFRAAFPEFTGIFIDVKGVKQDNGIIKYLFKDINIKDVVKILQDTEIENSDKILFRNKKFFSKILRKEKTFKDFINISDITKYKNFKDWLENNIINTSLYTSNTKKILIIWEISRNLLPCTNYITEWVNKIKIIKNNNEGDTYLKIAWKTLSKYRLRHVHLSVLHRILHAILIREGLFPLVTKKTNLILIGRPNAGKTSLIYKFISVIGKDLFYFVGNRPNDFSGYIIGEKPIIVWDDIFSLKKNSIDQTTTVLSGWHISNLLKIWGHEETSVDVKYKIPQTIPASRNIIISNYRELFNQPQFNNLRARLKIITIDPDIAQPSSATFKNKDEFDNIQENFNKIHYTKESIKIKISFLESYKNSIPTIYKIVSKHYSKDTVSFNLYYEWNNIDYERRVKKLVHFYEEGKLETFIIQVESFVNNYIDDKFFRTITFDYDRNSINIIILFKNDTDTLIIRPIPKDSSEFLFNTLKKEEFNFRRDWSAIRDEEFTRICFLVLDDLLATLELESQASSLNYKKGIFPTFVDFIPYRIPIKLEDI